MRTQIAQRRPAFDCRLRRRGVLAFVARVMAITMTCTPVWNPAWANPVGPQVVSGQVSMATSGNTLSITNSPSAIINWQSFSIKAGELTRFIQQNPGSSVLNRIVGQDPSQILGALQSNGRVFLINPNGVMFGAGARIDVNGLVASTLNLSNADFLAGRNNFTLDGRAGDVRNDGAITTPSGGQVLLIAPNVTNTGIITSPRGDVTLAAGHSVRLADSSNPAIRVVVSAPEDRALNIGSVIAQGGKVGIYGALVVQRGVVNANSVARDENGRIVFKASGDTLLEAGSRTSATGAAGGRGGEIQVLGERIGLTGDALVDASGETGGGTVLVGGDTHGANAAVQNAQRTFFGSDAVIKADAVQSGDGGKVVVWADDTTRAYGTISARGGAQSGNGGFAEVSGKQWLDFRARVDVGAAAGRSGTLLLDPASITLVGGTGDGASSNDGQGTFDGGGGAGQVLFSDGDITSTGVSNIYQSELEGLSPGTNIVLEASDLINATGTFAANRVTLPNNSNLTLRTRNANTDGTGTRGIDLVSGVNGGPFTLAASGTGTLTFQSGTGTSPQAADIKLPNLETAGGAIAASASGNLIVNAVAASTAPLALLAGSGGTLTINAPITAAGIDLGADNLALNDAIAATAVGVAPVTAGRRVTVGSALCTDDVGCLLIKNLFNINSPSISLGSRDPARQAGALNVAGITVGGTGVADRNAMTTRIALLSGSGITQSGTIDVPELAVDSSSVVNLPLANSVSNLAGHSNASFTFGNSPTLTVTSLAGGSGVFAYNLAGITAGDGIATLTSNAGDLVLDAAVSGIGNSVALNAAGMITGNGMVSTNDIAASAGAGIALISTIGTLAASNSGAASDITVLNTGVLTVNDVAQTAPGSTGNILIDNTGEMTVAAGKSVSTKAGNISLVAHSPLTVNGSVVSANGGSIALGAGPSLSTADNLTIASTGSVSTSGTVLLTAGNIITNSGSVTGSTTLLPFQNLALCIVNPTLPGCSAILPTLSACTTTPTLPGCEAVLPSLSACTVTPSLPGCSVVLPTLSACTTTSTLAGCSAVLPSLSTCTATPTLSGCSAVLPTLSACTTTPTLAGCGVVLPSLSACTATPTLDGCSAVLPTLSACTATPTLSGCGVVLPSLSACTATPTLAGCSVVLPTLSACTATPTLAGCSAVLPTLSVCTATPTLPGCSVVLPSLSACTTTPTLSGCSAVLPSVSICTATPTLPGCSAVLPSVSACTVTPTLPGCSAVLPSVAVCTTTPTLAGCSAVLPSLSACIAAPATAGCSTVLPSLAACLAAPSTAGCSTVLPSLSSCVVFPSISGCSAVLPTLSTCVTTPSAAGCSAVLPTLATCTTSPTIAGCSAVLPTLATCTVNPAASGCSVVLPPMDQCVANPTLPVCASVSPASQNSPVTLALNTTVNIINVASPAITSSAVPVVLSSPGTSGTGNSGSSSTGGTSSTTLASNAGVTSGDSAKDADKKDEKANTVVAKDSGAKKDEPVRKLYCN